ncbi:MAG: AAA-like domain-containing protein [Planctomycetota bacterium]|nr:AAA-like domain-containing protein [Planctomycetota bacterium]
MEKICVLFLAASPKVSPLSLDEEIREITTKIRAADYRDSLEVISRWAVRPDDLQQALLEHRPHVLHFSGHGTESEELVLLDSQGNPKPVSKEALVHLLSVLKDNLRLVVLNACFSRPQAEAITQVIDCAVGMNRAVGDEAAIKFAAAFYRAVGFGRSIQTAFDLGRSALMLDDIPEESTPELVARAGVDPTGIVLVQPDQQRHDVEPPTAKKSNSPKRSSRKTKARNKAAGSSPQSARFFISYAHGNPDDHKLAGWLTDQLTAAGHTAFLDERMQLGENWKDEIPRTIEESDVFVVLLSETSVQSDMVHEEVLIARTYQHRTGRPRLAPVRVRYSRGELGYVLGAYLRSYQWRNWESDADSEGLLQEITGMADGVQAQRPKKAAAAGKRAPAPAVIDLNSIHTPGGAMRPDDPLYLERSIDAEALARVARTGETTVLLGSRQSGKSSLLNRCLDQCSRHSRHFASVDLSLIDKSRFDTLADLLRELARAFLREFRMTADVGDISSPNEMTWFLEDHVLKVIDAPITLVMDEVDRVFEAPYRSDFFGMIRGWHNARGKVGSMWKDVGLLLAISTEPHLLMVDQYQSPFNVSPPIRLPWFQIGECQALNERYGMLLSDADVNDVNEFLGGHPYLTQLAFYELSRANSPGLLHLQLHATDQHSPFSDHLQTLLSRMQERPELIEGMQRIVRFNQLPDDNARYRLQAAGLVRMEDGRPVASTALYARFWGNP